MDRFTGRRRHPSSQVPLEAIAIDIEEGKWCEACNRSSAVAFTQLIHTKATLLLIARRDVWLCHECGSWFVIHC